MCLSIYLTTHTQMTLPIVRHLETINVTEADGLLEDRMYTASVEARNQFGRIVSEARTICK